MHTLNPDSPDTDLNDGDVSQSAYEATVAVFSAPDGVTAEIVRGALDSEGIHAVIGEQVSDMLGHAIALAESYWGEVRVPASEADSARAIVASFEAGDGAITDDTILDAA